MAKPFIKWAGGKSQLINEIRQNYPSELGITVNKYCEPFIGGGAVLFDVLQNYTLQEIYINDINPELINVYYQLQNYIDDMITELSDVQKKFWNMSTDERKLYYYEKRNRFNDIKIKVNGDESINLEKAVIFIFLNKTCFNGLYRVNKKGLFNVPIGLYKKPLICDKDNLLEISNLLKNVTITCGDYRQCEDFIDKNTFVYLDPPYRPLSETASFKSYAKTPFDDKEQVELGKFVDIIHHKGAKVILSNSDPKNNDCQDDFFDDLYSSYEIKRVTAKRMINCNGESRGNITELLINNF